jgi:cytochrome d ubiquinol oxidase subunit II
MFLQSLPLVFVLIGLVLYVVLGGADFGAGFWQLFAGRGEEAERVREYAHNSIGPVWEANHVWLIFVLTVFWTAYPEAFGSIASTLAVPLFIAAIGIIFRGAAYALRAGAASRHESGLIDMIFSTSSIITPFALGAAIGAIATDRVPVGNEAAGLFSSWLNPTSIFIGLLAVTVSAYLAAVYLAADASRADNQTLERGFHIRALSSGVVAGAVAIAGIFVVNADSQRLFHSLLTGSALAAVIVSVLAGLVTLTLVYLRRSQAARYTAAAAVAAIIAGWALARWPTLLPGLTVYRAAAAHDILVWLILAVLVGAAILFPSLWFLFDLTLAGRFEAAEQAAPDVTGSDVLRRSPGLLARLAVACLLAGVGLLNLADAGWAHAVGVLFLLGFTVTAFFAVVSDALPSGPGPQPPSDDSRARSQAGVPGRRSSHSRISFNSPR